MNIQEILQRTDVWRGGLAPSASALGTGFPALDTLLAGGWPRGALTEILTAHTGLGELRLLLPALARLSREDRWLAFIAPPYIPYAPALAAAGVDLSRVLLIHPRDRRDALWATEQALRSGTCGMVLAWPQGVDHQTLRRLQLAAEAGGAWGVLFRPLQSAAANSPAALRLRLAPATDTGNFDPARGRLAVQVLKRRGGRPADPLLLEVNHAVAVHPSSPSAARGIHARHARA